MCVVVYACVHAPHIGVSAWCVCVFMRALGSSKGPWCAYIVHVCALVNSCALMHGVRQHVCQGAHTHCECLHGMVLRGCLPGPVRTCMAVHVITCVHVCL